MKRVAALVGATLPAADDPAMQTLLRGLCRATGACGAQLSLRSAAGDQATYCYGNCEGARLVFQLHPSELCEARCDLFEAGKGPAASPAVLEAIQPLLESAIHALTERSLAAVHAELLSQVLGTKSDANFLLCATGELLWSNARGEELLQRQPAPFTSKEGSVTQPLLALLREEVCTLIASGERSRRQLLAPWGEEKWTVELVALSGLRQPGCCFVSLTPVKLPTAPDLYRRLRHQRVSRRESEVLALVLAGHKTAEIATQLSISEYTVKDHLKHAYAKLGISSRTQLLARFALLPTS